MDIPPQLQEAIKNDQLVVFAGAGLSLNFKLPSWESLVIETIELLNKEELNYFIPVLKHKLMTPLEVLDKLESEHEVVRRYICDNFSIKNGDFSLHKKLLKLTGKIITTNYDDAFEQASENQIYPTIHTSTFNISKINKSNAPYIFKLHGSHHEPDNCIVFTTDYEKLYSNDTATIEKLKSIFNDKTILFLGFGFGDDDINVLFRHLDGLFGNFNKHFILTTSPKNFESFKFLKSIEISDFKEIDKYIDLFLLQKELRSTDQIKIPTTTKKVSEKVPQVALLYPNPLDLTLKDDAQSIISYLDSLNMRLYVGYLNIKTLLTIDEYDLVIIVSKAFKSNLYIETDHLKSDLLSPQEICDNIPNENIPIIFISDDKIDPIPNRSIVVSSYKPAIIKRLIFKIFRNNQFDFIENEIVVSVKSVFDKPVEKGSVQIRSLYGNDKDLSIGKKSLINVVGRIEEQSAIAHKVVNIIRTNKLLNIKASGGIGKTTIIKKVAYELYNRGYFKSGVTFNSCENVKSYEDFEELIIRGFNLINILNFKEYISQNFSSKKQDILIILDNFETVVNNLSSLDYQKMIDLLKYATDYGNIVVTSREKISKADDFEDVFSLTPMITDDALALFIKDYGQVSPPEIPILRSDILENLLNNNPLAIRLVTRSRTRFRHISELRDQLNDHFFESLNEDYSLVYKNDVDLNIEKTKSIYQSINYSYSTLNSREKLSFELLNLFPDGISLANFKKCFERRKSTTLISDKELRALRDKSLIEDYNGTLQLQPIIRRFAEFQFSKKPKETKQKYCSDAYRFNVYVLNAIRLIDHQKTTSAAQKTHNLYKNNLVNALTYIPDMEYGDVSKEKKYTLNYVCDLRYYILSEKQSNEFNAKIDNLKAFYSDIPNAEILINSIKYEQTYFSKEFDESYNKLSEILPVDQIEHRDFSSEDPIEKKFRDLISNIHSMEGYALSQIKAHIKNNDAEQYLDPFFYYLGIIDNISRKKEGFYYFEYELMLNKLNVDQLEQYINTLYADDHLEIMQCTYTLSKAKILDKKTISKLVITNPYTRGLQELMLAFIATTEQQKRFHFEGALRNLFHIKYYYLECLFYYCLHLKETDHNTYIQKLQQGIELSKKHSFQFSHFRFENIDRLTETQYNFCYTYYNLDGLEEFVKKHNSEWEKEFAENKI